jgi:hypothetical protein
VRLQHRAGIFAHLLVVAQDLDALVAVQHANDLALDPRDGRELAGPIGLVVRPGDPGRIVELPLCRKAEAGRRETAGTVVRARFSFGCRCEGSRRTGGPSGLAASRSNLPDAVDILTHCQRATALGIPPVSRLPVTQDTD